MTSTSPSTTLEQQLREMNEALLVSSIRQHELTEQAQHAEAAAHESHSRFETIFDTSPICMYLVDAELRIRQLNKKALPVFGDIGELIGRDFGEIIHILWKPEIADAIVAQFQHTLATGEPYISPEFSEDRLDRKVREYYDWQIHRITLPDGQYGVVCYFIDVSERIRLSNELRQFAADLSDTARRKDEFLAMLSHELRNPLAPILNSVYLLGLGQNESVIQKSARMIIERQLGNLSILWMISWKYPASQQAGFTCSGDTWTCGLSRNVAWRRFVP